MTSATEDSDEHAHEAQAASGWSETWEFRVSTRDASLGVAVVVVRRPAEQKVSYWCSVLGEGRSTIAVIEHDIDLPDRGLELRASGIWADHICETPHEHWSLGLEALGLIFDEPADAVSSERGHSTSLGLDLEWESAPEPHPLSGGGDEGYVSVGFSHGDVLVGDATMEIEGPGHRLHRWGTGAAYPSWWSSDDHAATGPPPLSEPRPLARSLAADAGGSVTELALAAHPGTPGRPPSALWWSTPVS